MSEADGDIDDYETCPGCDGEGWLLDECFEDTCCCADPEEEHDMIPCQFCNHEGKR